MEHGNIKDKKIRINIKKDLKEFYESYGRYGEDRAILFNQYGTDGVEVRYPLRFMIMYEGQLKTIKSMVNSGQDILDVGAGDGLLAETLIKDAKTVTALDISLSRIKRCAERCKNGNFVVADAEDLPFKKENFNCIIASELIEHLIEPEKFLRSAFDVLKKGGALIISTPSALFYENNLSEILRDQHVHTFSPRRLISLLKRTGFGPRVIRGVGFKLRIKIPKPLAVLPRIFYLIIIRKRPKRGFISPISLEFNLALNKFINKIDVNMPISRRIFGFLCYLGGMCPSVASQVIIRAERL
jgi:2-polyprenyl-3-methyl-5-hydroxy-6-metoxy-1,4-benzoquinol methylase